MAGDVLLGGKGGGKGRERESYVQEVHPCVDMSCVFVLRKASNRNMVSNRMGPVMSNWFT